MPVPSSSESSIKWPVISESCQLSARKSKSNDNLDGAVVIVVVESEASMEDAVAGKAKGEERCRGRGECMPRGGGRRLAGGVEVSESRLEDSESSRKSVGGVLRSESSCGLKRRDSDSSVFLWRDR